GALPAPQAGVDPAFDPALVPADCDLVALARRLAAPGAPRAVSLLLSGPPGTGKSAYARYLADMIGVPAVQKRASDLLGPYVGQSEARIAEAFAEARDSGALLIFDEADSLLGDRRGAHQGWEVTQVNEMLTWMESHPLPFVCTTNLADRLDPASMRRFLIKARFRYLDAAQAEAAFRRFFGMAAPAELLRLRALTPADFALVTRRAALIDPAPDAAGLMALLAAESEAREGARAIGFTA
ncbi:ATP-binding protein, partial [Acidisphaera rubrifaciens]|uniref:ATP-binding protein n=1 Tax=Acidisphaera rubrifaciens TaxID=50715 RepID=UPI000662A42F